MPSGCTSIIGEPVSIVARVLMRLKQAYCASIFIMAAMSVKIFFKSVVRYGVFSGVLVHQLAYAAILLLLKYVFM